MIKLSLLIFLQKKFLPECYKTQKKCDKAVNRCFFVFDSIFDRYKNQEIRKRDIYKDPFQIVYCSNKYKAQRMFDEAVDDCLAALNFVTEWFVTSKMLEKLVILYTLMMIYSFIMKIFIKSHLLLIKNIFLL